MTARGKAHTSERRRSAPRARPRMTSATATSSSGAAGKSSRKTRIGRDWNTLLATASLQQTQDLAAIVHLCGAGPAAAFARSGFQPMPGERCGDHDVAVYLARVNAMKRQFRRLAAER